MLAFTAYQAVRAASALDGTVDGIEQLQADLVSGDQQAARDTLEDVQEEAGTARSNTRGPVWWLAATLPGPGENVAAVRTVSEIADALAQDALPEVVGTSETLRPEQLRPRRGRIDLAPLQQAEPAVVRAAEQIARQAEAADRLDPDALAGPLAGPVADLQAKTAEAAALADRASRAVRLLPGMLGADGPRRYLFMFQNNAEIRSTGGIPGAFAVVTARDGRIRLGQQGSAGTIGQFAEPPVPVSSEERDLFGSALGRFPQSVNLTPDFPRSAELINGMYDARQGRTFDGVVSADPVALSYLLAGTGPVEGPIGPDLTAENAVQRLLSDVYAEIPVPAAQDVYFEQAARQVFGAVTSGEGDPRKVLDGLVRAASEQRVLLWSAREEEQQLLGPTAISGRMDDGQDATPDVGVFLNAALAYKLDYHLDHEASLESSRCVGQRQQLDLSMTLTSTVPADFRSLTQYVSPDSEIFGRGTLVETYYLVLPEGGMIEKLVVNGTEQDYEVRPLGDRGVVRGTVIVPRGDTATIEARVLSGKGELDDPQLRVTPGARNDGVGDVTASLCR